MIPEVAALDTRPAVIRIPAQIDVPVTNRVIRLIDTQAFQRLSGISQLGLVARVYPGARHTRFEHSLGVYRNALAVVRRLSQFGEFCDLLDDADVEALIVATLLHDIGHWPFCHPIEDIGLDSMPEHEDFAAEFISADEIADLIAADWSCDLDLVKTIIKGEPSNPRESLLCSILSGPIDVDKMDYLYRDSLHCGVPYGMNFDSTRLINSICLNEANDGIAISSKGKTAAEMMVFARYVMFSEVYWHHAVRSSTAMLQRAFYNVHRQATTQDIKVALAAADDESTFGCSLLSDSKNIPAVGLFGPERKLYKRLLDFSADGNTELYKRISHQPYDWLRALGNKLAEDLSGLISNEIHPDELLIDAPPTGLEVQFKVCVRDGDQYSQLEDISPVVKALAQRQFDDFVKKVRVFVHPRLATLLDPQSCSERLTALALAN